MRQLGPGWAVVAGCSPSEQECIVGVLVGGWAVMDCVEGTEQIRVVGLCYSCWFDCWTACFEGRGSVLDGLSWIVVG